MIKSIKPFFIYWTIGCILVGVLLAPLFYQAKPEEHEHHHEHGDQHLNHEHQHHSHGLIEVTSEKVPEIKIELVKDKISGWNLWVKTQNFTFTPEKINQKPIQNEGHAHIYVDGEKLTRLYGHNYHLSEFAPGKHEVSVSLNGNDHSNFAVNGQPIMAKAIINQP